MRKAIAATTLAAGLIVAPAIDSVHAQAAAEEEDDDGSNLGLLGLVGLAGLAGLAGLKRRDSVDTRRSGGASSSGLR